MHTKIWNPPPEIKFNRITNKRGIAKWQTKKLPIWRRSLVHLSSLSFCLTASHQPRFVIKNTIDISQGVSSKRAFFVFWQEFNQLGCVIYQSVSFVTSHYWISITSRRRQSHFEVSLEILNPFSIKTPTSLLFLSTFLPLQFASSRVLEDLNCSFLIGWQV